MRGRPGARGLGAAHRVGISFSTCRGPCWPSISRSGAHPAPLRSVTIASAAASVVADVDGAGFDDVVLVGHSLAGCSMPATIGVARQRVPPRGVLACVSSEHGKSGASTHCPPSAQASHAPISRPGEPGVLSAEDWPGHAGNDRRRAVRVAVWMMVGGAPDCSPNPSTFTLRTPGCPAPGAHPARPQASIRTNIALCGERGWLRRHRLTPPHTVHDHAGPDELDAIINDIAADPTSHDLRLT